MLKKSIYLIIIFILSFILFNYLSTQSKTDKEQTSGAASFLINKQSTDPKRLFLKTWRITKNKYYDPTMNNQDWERWNRRYVDKIKTQEDANVAIDSMIASLNDPYTQYLDREEYKEQTTSIDARIMGIGINIVSVDGNVLIVSVVEGTPAEETGIKAGDIILTVDGKDVRGKTVSDVASLIRGKEGQSVKIELDVKVGDKVRIISGPFADFIGDITEVYPDKSKLRASVSIFGRETPVELEYKQIQKV